MLDRCSQVKYSFEVPSLARGRPPEHPEFPYIAFQPHGGLPRGWELECQGGKKQIPKHDCPQRRSAGLEPDMTCGDNRNSFDKPHNGEGRSAPYAHPPISENRARVRRQLSFESGNIPSSAREPPFIFRNLRISSQTTRTLGSKVSRSVDSDRSRVFIVQPNAVPSSPNSAFSPSKFTSMPISYLHS